MLHARPVSRIAPISERREEFFEKTKQEGPRTPSGAFSPSNGSAGEVPELPACGSRKDADRTGVTDSQAITWLTSRLTAQDGLLLDNGAVPSVALYRSNSRMTPTEPEMRASPK
jgi:hypothetical protein